MDEAVAALTGAGIQLWESSFSALDAYHGIPAAPVRFLAAGASLVDVAKATDDLEYRGLPYAEASLSTKEGGLVHLRCLDSRFATDDPGPAFAPLELLRDPVRRVFLDPRSIYATLRKSLLEPRFDGGEALFEAAILVSRYEHSLPGEWLPSLPGIMSPVAQRDLLCLILTGSHPEHGLELLRKAGFLAAFWPELDLLYGIGQSKEYHPEGDAWEHTLETFHHRKIPELRLSLGLLLHDTGKPRAAMVEGRRFDRHAEIGRAVAERFLRRLGFDERLVSDVSYLTRFHMLPAALPRLPFDRVREAIEDPRFPILLELYRCDELSTFRGPEGYYEACAVYRDWMRHSRNPWRDEEGRKLARLYVEVPAEHRRAAQPVPAGGAAKHGRGSRGRKRR